MAGESVLIYFIVGKCEAEAIKRLSTFPKSSAKYVSRASHFLGLVFQQLWKQRSASSGISAKRAKYFKFASFIYITWLFLRLYQIHM
jgi:hypothetical protein